MNQQNKTERWVEELYRLDVADPDSRGCTITLGEFLRVDCPELENFITQLLSDTRREASAEGFKKGYIKGALDKEWGQTTAEEEIEKIRREERKRCLEALPVYEHADNNWCQKYDNKYKPCAACLMDMVRQAITTTKESIKRLDQISQSIEEGVVK